MFASYPTLQKVVVWRSSGYERGNLAQFSVFFELLDNSSLKRERNITQQTCIYIISNTKTDPETQN
jgi:hypothetical protein